jgi:hypothetical protein
MENTTLPPTSPQVAPSEPQPAPNVPISSEYVEQTDNYEIEGYVV